MQMHALLLAGGVMDPSDPLFSEGVGGNRSLIDIHGKPMAQWVLDVLSASPVVGEIYVMGLSEGCGLTSKKPVHYLLDGDTLFDNIRSGVLQIAQEHPNQSKVLLASADIPAVRPEMITWLAEKVSQNPNALVYYNVVPREAMETRFPGANRSYVKFRDIAVCGGDLNVVDTHLFAEERPVWKAITENRKHPLKQVMLLGLGNLIMIALRLATLEIAVKRVAKKLNIEACALICPYAEMAMDADKPHQLAILRDDLGILK
jgi:molybdopterin-guanine dinucleotide biosynthesis protein A